MAGITHREKVMMWTIGILFSLVMVFGGGFLGDMMSRNEIKGHLRQPGHPTSLERMEYIETRHREDINRIYNILTRIESKIDQQYSRSGGG